MPHVTISFFLPRDRDINDKRIRRAVHFLSGRKTFTFKSERTYNEMLDNMRQQAIGARAWQLDRDRKNN